MSVTQPPSGVDAATSELDESDAATPAAWNADVEDLLEEWRLRAWAAQMAHYRVAAQLRRYNVLLGLPVVVFTTAVGTSLFATLNREPSKTVRIVIGGISVIAAILAAVQTFFNFAQRADQHVLAADWYSSIRRRVEEELHMPRKARGDPRKFMDGVRKEMNAVGSQFPEIGEKVWRDMTTRFGLDHVPDDRPLGRHVAANRP